MKLTVIILAAGLGTRMRSSLPKALHPLAGKPLVQHVLDAVRAMGPVKPVLVVGHKADMVRKAVERYTMDIVYQERQLGTGHAVRQAADAIAQAEGPCTRANC